MPTAAEMGKQREGQTGSPREKLPNIYAAKSKGEVTILSQSRNTLIYDAGGRVFAIEVTELEGDLMESAREAKKIAVGY